jgi:hypothetical protein
MRHRARHVVRRRAGKSRAPVRNNPHPILPIFRRIAGIPSFDLPGWILQRIVRPIRRS